MRRLIIGLTVSLLTSAANSASAQSRLPPCPGSFGVDTWTHCVGSAASRNGRYVGEWKDDQYNGQGAFTLFDGGKYVGEWRDGKPDGQGTFTWPDGSNYVGEWKAGKANGQGTYIWPGGNMYVGEWKDDKPNGQGIEYRPDGTIVRSGVWNKGAIVGRP